MLLELLAYTWLTKFMYQLIHSTPPTRRGKADPEAGHWLCFYCSTHLPQESGSSGHAVPLGLTLDPQNGNGCCRLATAAHSSQDTDPSLLYLAFPNHLTQSHGGN